VNLQTVTGNDQSQNLRVTSRREKVETRVDPSVVVGVQRPLHLQLLLKVRFKLLVDVVNDWLVAAHDEQQQLTTSHLLHCQ